MFIAGKKYRIKSGSRFSFFVALMIVIGVMFSNTALGFNNASSMTEQEYQEITVEAGDTLWNIASTYMPDNKDIRRAVYTLCCLNEIAAHELRAGQSLIVPVN